MIDLFGEMTPQFASSAGLQQVVFSENEVEDLFDELILNGRLLEDAGEALARLKKASSSSSELNLSLTRKDAWKELLWVFGLDEPSPVSFDIACAVCDVDSENIRNLISQGFGDELRLMYSVLSSAAPQKREAMAQKLSRYIFLH